MSNSKKAKKVCLSYTRREWLEIEKAIESLGRRNGIASYIIEGTNKLNIDTSTLNDESMLEIEQRTFWLPESSLEILMGLSTELNIPRSTLVARLIITPLLTK